MLKKELTEAEKAGEFESVEREAEVKAILEANTFQNFVYKKQRHRRFRETMQESLKLDMHRWPCPKCKDTKVDEETGETRFADILNLSKAYQCYRCNTPRPGYPDRAASRWKCPNCSYIGTEANSVQQYTVPGTRADCPDCKHAWNETYEILWALGEGFPFEWPENEEEDGDDEEVPVRVRTGLLLDAATRAKNNPMGATVKRHRGQKP